MIIDELEDQLDGSLQILVWIRAPAVLDFEVSVLNERPQAHGLVLGDPEDLLRVVEAVEALLVQLEDDLVVFLPAVIVKKLLVHSAGGTALSHVVKKPKVRGLAVDVQRLLQLLLQTIRGDTLAVLERRHCQVVAELFPVLELRLPL